MTEISPETVPVFAVVGRSNKGKSSIVATLTENDSVAIAPTPRTTQVCQSFSFTIAGEKLLTIVDTPGFEEAPAVLEWLKSVDLPAHQRPQRVRDFLKHYKDSERFRFERELLTPIMQGAAVLYVIDASHPYRPNYEAEFEILLWTGQPSMALINQIGPEDHLQDWKHALNQYFKLVRIFNAHSSNLRDRLTLLEEMRVIHEAYRPSLDKAIAALKENAKRRHAATSLVIARLLDEAMRFQVRVRSKDRPPTPEEKKELVERFHEELRELERQSRTEILQLFNYQSLKTEEEGELEKPVFDQDLFSRETWEVLGLTRPQLIMLGTAAGALAGGSLDAMVGHASMLLGTGIGALLGGMSSTYLALSDPEVAGFKISQKYWLIGPYENPNLPWVLLDRSLSFVEALLLRTHAQQTPLRIAAKSEKDKRGASSQFNAKELRGLAWQLKKLKWGLQSDKAVQDLALLIQSQMEKGVDPRLKEGR